MGGPADMAFGWHPILSEYAMGRIDAEDLWNAIDEYGATGRLPSAAAVPLHRPDVVDVEEAALVQEQAMRLNDLLVRFGSGGMSRDDLASEALEILGLTQEE